MNTSKTKKAIALERACELKSEIEDYLEVRDKIPKGMSKEQERKTEEKKQKILSLLNASEKDWNDYKWQLSNRITDLNILKQVVSLTQEEISDIKNVGQKYRWGISPYYLSLIDDDNKFDPVKLQSIPTKFELTNERDSDPMSEEFTNPAGVITRRYPDRLIINVTNICAMYCRHCQRRRNIGSSDHHNSKEDLIDSIEYIKANPEIR